MAAYSILAVAAFAADPSGTWKFPGFGRGGGGGGGTPPESTLTLAHKEGKLTGTLTMPGRGGQAGEPTEIKDASFKDDVVAFTVERTSQDGQKRVTKYSGKLEGDTITGKLEGTGRDGQPMSRDWVAKRAK